MSGSETCWDLVFHGCAWTTFLHLLHLGCITYSVLGIGQNHLASSLGRGRAGQGQCREKGVRVRPQARGEHRLREDRTQNPGDKQPVRGKERNYLLIPFLIFID